MSSPTHQLKKLFQPFDINLNTDKYKLEPKQLWDATFQLASVLVPLCFKDGEWFVLLTQRAKHLTRQPGTVSFPGGMKDGRETLIDTALREAEEEIGLPRSSVTIIAQLPPSIVRPMSLVYQVVGIIPNDFVPIIDKREVDFAFSLPLKRFLTDERRKRQDWTIFESNVFYIYHFEDTVNGNLVNTWGFTAGICMQVAMVVYQTEEEICLMKNVKTKKDTCFDISPTYQLAKFLFEDTFSAKL